jgi:hypothetical protein
MAMSADAQKLELINWITSLRDSRLLEQVYSQVKKTLESKKDDGKETPDSSGKSSVPASSEALALLEKITDAYVASKESDLNLEQIFTERTKANDRKIDFN